MTTAVNPSPTDSIRDVGSELPAPDASTSAPTGPAAPIDPADAPPAGGPPTPPSPPTSPDPAAPAERRRHGVWHVLGVIVGVLALMPGLGMLAGGTALVIANSTADDGYFDVTIDRVYSDGVAVATMDLWHEAGDDEDWPWVLDWLDVDVRLRVDGAGTTDDVFVGIARTADVEAYLADAPYAEVFDVDHHRPVYRRVTGDAAVEPPAAQTFWTVSRAGTGEQQLDWEARGGSWSIVVMNADGSPDVAADVELGVRSDAVTPIAITLIVTGGLLAIGSVTLIVLGVRGRRRS